MLVAWIQRRERDAATSCGETLWKASARQGTDMGLKKQQNKERDKFGPRMELLH
jgi:hypothetical protein